ncbi:MAG: GIY-YIG nuclease family protein [Candidatus Binataceae bacterium]
MKRHARLASYYVYVMASPSRVLYTGVTNDLDRRVSEHKSSVGSRFAARYHATRLVYFEEFKDIRVAIDREKQIKGLLRKKKIALIEALNPEWKDLSAEEQDRDSSLRSE